MSTDDAYVGRGRELAEVTRRAASLSRAVLFLLGVALAAALIFYGVREQPATTGVVALSIGASLVASLVFGVLDTTITREDFLRLVRLNNQTVLTDLAELRHGVQAREGARELGLTRVFFWDGQDDCRQATERFIAEADRLTVLLNYSYNWIERYEEAFVERFARSDKSTEFFFLDPDGAQLQQLASKQETSLQAMQDKLARTLRRLGALHAGQQHTLQVHGQPFFTPFAMLLSAEEAVVMPAFFSRVKGDCPSLWYRRTGGHNDYHSRLLADVADLRGISKPLAFPAT